MLTDLALMVPDLGWFRTVGMLLDVAQTWHDIGQVRPVVGRFRSVGALVKVGQTCHGVTHIWPTSCHMWASF